jgi:alpha-tubulin suppressor-like RCC1 family protein
LGYNYYNQCDPIFKELTDVISVSCGLNHSVVVKNDGTVFCWGNNDENQCDPIHQTFTNVVSISCGNYHSVALRSD